MVKTQLTTLTSVSMQSNVSKPAGAKISVYVSGAGVLLFGSRGCGDQMVVIAKAIKYTSDGTLILHNAPEDQGKGEYWSLKERCEI